MFRFGIMGAGGIAAKFCEAVNLVEGAEVAAVSSKSEDRAQKLADQYGISRYYGSYEEMLKKEKLDAVYIATTNNYHFQNSMMCIRYGVPVLCEKCMFMTSEEAETVFAAAKKAGVFTMEGMWSRFIPAVQKAREWVEEGRIGTIHIANYTGGVNVAFDHRIFDPELGGGVMYDLMVYPIEILLYLINQPLKSLQSSICYGSTGVDVTDNIILQFETCQAALQVTAHSRIPSPCGLYGSKGYIRLEQTHRASSVDRYNTEFELVDHFEAPVENGFEFEIMEVIKCIRAGKLESDIMPHEATLQCISIFERALNKREGRLNYI